ncbi:hypothetical protein HII13_000668 [Brettanomyces bruxellensis]|nr:hypothetical protein HII13_000668 [Brettanomyces bruxellensis]
MGKKYYAVANGRQNGVFSDWSSCKSSVNGYSNSQFKGFNSRAEAEAYVGGNSSSSGDASSSGGSSSGGYSRGYSGGSSFTPSYGGGYSGSYSSQKSTASSGRGSSGSSGQKSSDSSSHWVYTDGASKNNQDQSKSVAGYGVFFGHNDSRNVAAPLRGNKQSNQRAEIMGVDTAVDKILTGGVDKKYNIATDSMYTIHSLTDWGNRWRENGWKGLSGKPVENRDVIEPCLNKIDKLNEIYNDKGYDKLEFKHVPGHQGIEGNEMADKLANEGCRK